MQVLTVFCYRLTKIAVWAILRALETREGLFFVPAKELCLVSREWLVRLDQHLPEVGGAVLESKHQNEEFHRAAIKWKGQIELGNLSEAFRKELDYKIGILEESYVNFVFFVYLNFKKNVILKFWVCIE